MDLASRRPPRLAGGPGRGLGVSVGARGWLVAGAVLGLALVAGLGVGRMPWLVLGGTAGALLLLATLTHPLVVIGVMLAIGPIDLSFMTGGFKGLFESFGGLDMNGIRLIGVTVALSALILIDPKAGRVAFGRHGRWYVLFLFLAAGSLAYTISFMDGARLLLKLAYPLLFFVIVSASVRTTEDLGRLADWTLAGGAFICIVLNPVYALQGGYMVLDGFLRVGGVGTHQNPFSFYLVLMLFTALTRFSVRGKPRYLFLCAVFALWIVLAGTRIAFAGALVGLMGIALYGAIASRNYRVLVGAVLASAMIAIPLTPIVLERSLGYIPTVQQLVDLVRDPLALYHSLSWEGREVLWPVVFAAFLSSPWLGLGLGSSTGVMFQHFPPGWGGVIHNEYLRLLTDVGIIGSLIYLVAIAVWFRAVLRAGRNAAPMVREFAWPAIGGILAWAIVAITDNPFDYYSPFTQYIGFFCAGAIVADRLTGGEEEGTGGADAAGSEPLESLRPAPGAHSPAP